MPTLVGVRLRHAGKVLSFDVADNEPAEGDEVVVRTERGLEFGVVAAGSREVADSDVPPGLKPVVRVASEADREKVARFRERELEALAEFRQMVAERGLDMKPVDVEILFDESKWVFYFVAEERVDFRDLIKELSSHFKTRVDMRQIGVRDEARLVGGIGHCGEMLCCVRFGGEFQPVSIRMAKEQDLPLNPLKISGLCGRLMCCLRYEYDAYKDFKSRAPKRGAVITTPSGPGKVTELNTPRETLTLALEEGGRMTVPLAALECCSGQGCPCSVSAEALRELQASSTSVMLPSALEAKLTETPEPSPPTETKSRRRRKKPGAKEQPSARGAGGGERGRTKAAEPPAGRKSGESAQRRSDKPGDSSSRAQPPSSGGRRRRRRRPPGEGGKQEGST